MSDESKVIGDRASVAIKLELEEYRTIVDECINDLHEGRQAMFLVNFMKLVVCGSISKVAKTIQQDIHDRKEAFHAQ